MQAPAGRHHRNQYNPTTGELAPPYTRDSLERDSRFVPIAAGKSHLRFTNRSHEFDRNRSIVIRSRRASHFSVREDRASLLEIRTRFFLASVRPRFNPTGPSRGNETYLSEENNEDGRCARRLSMCFILLTASPIIRFTACRSTHAARDSSDDNSGPEQRARIILRRNVFLH